ncbi:MAG: hypothetical protein E6Q41_01695 [Cyclobacteriaceae bacterium]|nr:MAG: hypothetical protein E6Q41_01695 [Cyclobacteriaceae bacterium]
MINNIKLIHVTNSLSIAFIILLSLIESFEYSDIMLGFMVVVFLSSFIVLAYHFLTAIKLVQKNYEQISSMATFFFKFIMASAAIALIIILVVLGFVFNSQFFLLAIIASLLFFKPLKIMLTSKYVLLDEKNRLFGFLDLYGFSCYDIEIERILFVKSIIMGAEYKLAYKDLNSKVKTVYFYPKGGFIFHHPISIRKIEALLSEQV